MTATTTVKRLGDRLLDAGLITQSQLELALREQKRSGKLIGTTLKDLGFISEQDISTFLAQDAQTETIDLSTKEIDPSLISLLPYEFAKEAKLIPISLEGTTLTIVMADPFDVIAIDKVEQLTRFKVEVLTAPAADIESRLAQTNHKAGSIDETIDQLMKIGKTGEDTDNAAPMLRIVDQILEYALKQDASDVHFEPDDKSLRIRMRVDGILQPFVLIPKDLQNSLTARLKVTANLDVSETRLPQDGRFSTTIGRKEINLRVSTLPTNYGESVVLRILDSSGIVMELGMLDMRSEDNTALTDSILSPHGIILVTGPTGSGKTTTLYTALNAVNRKERGVFTLEDPIEYQLDHTRQTQTHEKIGLTFASGLRTLLRQDPDVILVGETRDQETAQLMVRAALTGHLVFSSLHTNDSFSAIPRLIDLGVEPFLLPSTLKLVIAQRLVRRLCTNCRVQVPNPAELLETYHAAHSVPSDVEIWQAGSCEKCNHKGYRGRAPIFEILEIDDDFKAQIPKGNIDLLKETAKNKKMPLLFDDGLRRVFDGITSLEEVFRVSHSS